MEKEFNLSEKILKSYLPTSYDYCKVEDIKEFIKLLKADDNKIMCDLLRGKITIGEAQARLLQSRRKLTGEKLVK